MENKQGEKTKVEKMREIIKGNEWRRRKVVLGKCGFRSYKKKKKKIRWACSRVFKTWLKQNLAKQS